MSFKSAPYDICSTGEQIAHPVPQPPPPPNSLISTMALRHKGVQPNGKSPDTNYWSNYRIPCCLQAVTLKELIMLIGSYYFNTLFYH